MASIIRSTRYSMDPALTIRVMVAQHTDIDGKVWPKGTLFVPLYAGRDNVIDRDYQVVDIKGREVRFER